MEERKYLVDEEFIRKTRDLIYNALVKNQRYISVEYNRDVLEIFKKCSEILKDAETERFVQQYKEQNIPICDFGGEPLKLIVMGERYDVRLTKIETRAIGNNIDKYMFTFTEL